MRYWLLLLISGAVWAGDHWFEGTAQPRHQEMVDYFNSGEYLCGERRFLLGSLGGMRSALARCNGSLSAIYVNDPLANVAGGLSRGFTNAGSLGVDFNVYWDNWNFYVSGVHRSGTNLSARRIGADFPVQQVFFGENLRLVELYLEYGVEDDPFTFKFGRLAGGNDFLTSPLYYHYVSSAINGNPVGVFFNTPFTSYPVSTWGIYAAVRPIDTLQVQAGIYNANSRIFQNRFHGLNFTFDNTNGWMLMNDWSYFPKTTLPGRYTLGGWWQTGRTDRFKGRQFCSNWGLYLQADQMIWGLDLESHPRRGLALWSALLYSPSQRNLFPWFVAAGLVFQGPFPHRHNDSINFGFTSGFYSTDQSSEMNIELNYHWRVTPYFYIAPDLQWVIDPSGLGTISDAFVAGCEVGVIF